MYVHLPVCTWHSCTYMCKLCAQDQPIFSDSVSILTHLYLHLNCITYPQHWWKPVQVVNAISERASVLLIRIIVFCSFHIFSQKHNLFMGQHSFSPRFSVAILTKVVLAFESGHWQVLACGVSSEYASADRKWREKIWKLLMRWSSQILNYSY